MDLQELLDNAEIYNRLQCVVRMHGHNAKAVAEAFKVNEEQGQSIIDYFYNNKETRGLTIEELHGGKKDAIK